MAGQVLTWQKANLDSHILSSKIKNKTHLRHFGISVYTLQQHIGCKFEWLKSNKSTECKINTSTRNGSFTNSKSCINYFLRWKWTNLQMFVPLVCLDSLNHKMYFVFSCISSLTWCLRKTMGKSHVDSLSQIITIRDLKILWLFLKASVPWKFWGSITWK